ncbi:FdhE protein [Novimethylophilus kurashikiensis]|uniref:FdhE protein n=1 Tax=Novimethylophilus kurashikiensis TaxID=1825523 RepID=A0A2R5FCV9_9PROT|nr:formate dehydrogenase accessory protein FdhE [Novimethylophilus kurashikiensis]GBG15845.1 FdhE protein [Novimethylophilus kurashikiensis]
MSMEQPINFVPGGLEIPFLHVADANTLFLDRALRFEQLAPGHAVEDYLRFMATVAKGQHAAVSQMARPWLPTLQDGRPPLSVDAIGFDSNAWLGSLRAVVEQVLPASPTALQAQFQPLADASDTTLVGLARAYFSSEFIEDNVALMPIVGAGLQVYWSVLVQQLAQVQALPLRGQAALDSCPVCGSMPVGGIVRSGGASQGLRYLACSLCATQWHMERIHCVACGDSAKIGYFSIEGENGAIQAEACDACHTYTKLGHAEKSPGLELVADDVASLALDVLMGEEGYQRYGLNSCLLLST